MARPGVRVAVPGVDDGRGNRQLDLPQLSPFAPQKCVSDAHFRGAKGDNKTTTLERTCYATSSNPSYRCVLLLFQRADGGWPKDYDMTAVLTSEQRGKVLATRSREDAS